MLPVGVPKEPLTVAVHVLATLTATGFGAQTTVVVDGCATNTVAVSWKCPAFAWLHPVAGGFVYESSVHVVTHLIGCSARGGRDDVAHDGGRPGLAGLAEARHVDVGEARQREDQTLRRVTPVRRVVRV